MEANAVRKFLVPLFLALLLTIIGCSSSGGENPVQPAQTELRIPELGQGHGVIGVQDMRVDPVTGTVTSTPNRTLAPHYNITNFIDHPNCPNSKCVYFLLYDYDPEENIYYIDIYLMNPTLLSPWDPRIIILLGTDTDEFEVVNADSWTTLFDPDDEFPDNVNPFIALGKDEVAQRRLLPYPYWETEQLWMWKNPDSTEPFMITYILEINWPGHCREPYEINNIQFLGDEVDSSYEGSLHKASSPLVDKFTIACDVWDWQDDVYEVSCYAPSVVGDEDWHLMSPDPFGPPERWVYTSNEISDVEEGYYDCWFRAASDEPTDQTNVIYQHFYFPVYHYDDDGTGGIPGDPKTPRIAYIKDVTGYADIYIKELYLGGSSYDLLPTWDDTEEHSATIGDAFEGTAYKPIVVFSSDYGGQYDLHMINIDGNMGSWEQLIDDEWGDFGPMFHPDYPNNDTVPMLDVVFYSFVEGNADIWAIDLDNPPYDASDLTQLTFGLAADITPCIYTDPNWGYTFIAFSSNRVAWDNYEIFVRMVDPFFDNPIRITWDPARDVRPTWSPRRKLIDSELVWASNRNGDYDLYKYEADTGYVLPLLIRDKDQIDPCYSPNSKQVIFAWNNEEQFNLWTIPWDGNEEFLFPRTSNSKDEWAPYWGWIP